MWYTDNGRSARREGAKHLPHIVAVALQIPHTATQAEVSSALQELLRRDISRKFGKLPKVFHDLAKSCIEPWNLALTHAQFIELRELYDPLLIECSERITEIDEAKFEVETNQKTVDQLRNELQEAEQKLATAEDVVVTHEQELQSLYDGNNDIVGLKCASHITNLRTGIESVIEEIDKQMDAIKVDMATVHEEYVELYDQELKHFDPAGEPCSPSVQVKLHDILQHKIKYAGLRAQYRVLCEALAASKEGAPAEASAKAPKSGGEVVDVTEDGVDVTEDGVDVTEDGVDESSGHESSGDSGGGDSGGSDYKPVGTLKRDLSPGTPTTQPRRKRSLTGVLASESGLNDID